MYLIFFLCYFIFTQVFISLYPYICFFSISFLPGTYFIAALALFLFYFIPTQPLISLASYIISFLFHFYPGIYFIAP